MDTVLDNLLDYNSLLDDFYCKKQAKPILRLPSIQLEYRNTFSKILNFHQIVESLKVSELELGNFLHVELGTRQWSIQSQGVLVFKGKTSVYNVSQVIKNFIRQHKCIKCDTFTVNKIKRMNISQLMCENCEEKLK